MLCKRYCDIWSKCILFCRYYKLDPLKTLKENLSGKTIIEFPTLHVVLPEKADMYQVEMDDNLNQPRPGNSKQESTCHEKLNEDNHFVVGRMDDTKLTEIKEESAVCTAEISNINGNIDEQKETMLEDKLGTDNK